MSVKEFFAFSSIKPTVLEFLKHRADFSGLEARFKKPFRAYINRHSSVQQGQRSAPQNHTDDEHLVDFFVSDGFCSIKCLFSDQCKEMFEQVYPSSVKISTILNMLICIQSFRIEIRAPFALAQPSEISEKQGAQMFENAHYNLNMNLVKNMEVVLVVDELRVISFDRFGMKMPSSLAFDDQVRSHLNVLRHFLMKQLILPQKFEMAQVSNLSRRATNVTNEERSAFFPHSALAQNSRTAPNRSNLDQRPSLAPSNAMFDHESVVQIRDDEQVRGNGALKAGREGK